MTLSYRSGIHYSPLRLPVLNEMAKFAGLCNGTRLCVIEAGNGREARPNTGSHLQCRGGLLGGGVETGRSGTGIYNGKCRYISWLVDRCDY
jgi:hypothetical protein